MTDRVLSLGMMSGTSVDGAIDAAILETDGEESIDRKFVGSYRYESGEGIRPIHHCTKAGEVAFRIAKGNHAEAVKKYPEALRQYVSESFGLKEGKDVERKVLELTVAYKSVADSDPTIESIIEISTEYHRRAAEEAIRQSGIPRSRIAFAGYHGQTLYHAPFERITVQVGNASKLADALSIPVVAEFRKRDIEHGGQGAPLAPVYHRALVRSKGLGSAAILNLGGTANITIIDSASGVMLGFDTGPANGLVDRYVNERAGLAMDRDSALALAGKVEEGIVKILTEESVKVSGGKNYLELPPPKSLDIRDYTFSFPEFLALKLEDGCATLNAFTAECVARGLDWIAKAGLSVPNDWILCGGGAMSPHLTAQVKNRVESRIGKPITLHPAETMGWSAQGMEAELFAYLAVRASRGLPITFPGTTGVAMPLSGGTVFNPACGSR